MRKQGKKLSQSGICAKLSMTVIYSYAPGTGGDHIVNLLNGTAAQFAGPTVKNTAEIKSLEHSLQYLNLSQQEYTAKVEQRLNQGHRVIASHSLQIIPNTTVIRAVWTDPALTWRFACRDMMTMDFVNGLLPVINQDPSLKTILTDGKSTIRRRWLNFIHNHYHYGEARHNESVPDEFIKFSIERLFTAEFAEDICMLAQQLKLEWNYYQIKQQHLLWLQKNPPEAFTLRRAVKHCENLIVQIF